MRKLLFLFLILVLFVPKCYAALTQFTVWEVRTTGASTNGGGFNAAQDAVNGVDYSQQDAAQLTLTDCATTGAVAVLTSVTGGFTHAMEGNIIYIASGTNFTAGYYEIVTYTNSNTVTLDRVCATGAGISGNIKVGGAVNHPDRIASILGSDNVVWVKFGTYVKIDGYQVIKLDGANRPILIGYNTTRGDNPTGNNRPTLDCQTVDDYGIYITTQAFNAVVANFIFANADSYGAENDVSATFINCRATGNYYSGFYVYADGGTVFFNCSADLNGEYGFYMDYPGSLNFCSAFDNTYAGFADDGGSFFTNCIAYSNDDDGFEIAGATMLYNCISYNNVADGFDIYPSTTAINCIAHSNGTYGFIRASNVIAAPFDYNCYYNNTTANLYNITAGTHDVNANPLFTNAAGLDFTLQAGSPCLGAGFPQALTELGLTGDYQWNIGIDQDDNVAGGGGTGSLSVSTNF